MYVVHDRVPQRPAKENNRLTPNAYRDTYRCRFRERGDLPRQVLSHFSDRRQAIDRFGNGVTYVFLRNARALKVY